MDLPRVGNDEFRNALTVHPVTSAEFMYHLHKHFTEIELQRTYKEIEKLQVRLCLILYNLKKMHVCMCVFYLALYFVYFTQKAVPSKVHLSNRSTPK